MGGGMDGQGTPRMKGLARWAAVLAVAGLLTSCGEAVPDSAADPHQDPASVEAKADAISTQMWGTAEQKEAAHYLDFMELNAGTVDCIGEAGHTFVPSFTHLYAGWVTNSIETGGWLGKLDWAPSDRAERAGEFGGEPEDQPMPAGASQAYKDAMDECSQVTEESNVQLGNPVGADDLAFEFQQMLDEVNSEIGPIEPYNQCMGENGITLEESGATGLAVYFSQAAPTSRYQPNNPNTQWAAFLPIEADALAADRDCREDEYLRALTLLEPRLDTFADDHAEELASYADAWQQLATEATQAGYVSEH